MNKSEMILVSSKIDWVE